ncbi:hypothetical protein B0J11DRAFT_430340 [Dendryphion nanum]|uniref:Aminodeoxychorismate lyase n=1 Tax=Dendryphion nanum TaxID=256645 RepID=A0A9P9IT90_9PLEO|nr:hypothetical protein B0J11DRAFT_430340 [Dendryphion nanum]
MSTEASEFRIISTIRYDPLLLTSSENSQPALSFVSPSPFYMLVYHRDRLLEAAQHFEFPAVEERLADGKVFHNTLLEHIQQWKEKGGQDGALKLRILFDGGGKLTVECAILPPLPLSSLFPTSLDRPKIETASHLAKAFEPSPLTGGALELGPTDSLPSRKEDPTTWKLRLDSAPTPSSPLTVLKTTHRDLYNTSRARALPANPSAPANVEVVMYNECDELTEGSITSIYVYRGGRWVTPPVGVPAGHFTARTLKGEKDGERWDEGELRKPFAGRWGHSVRGEKVGAGGQRGTTRRWALAKGMCMEEPVSINTVRTGEGVWVSNGVIGFGFGTIV